MKKKFSVGVLLGFSMLFYCGITWSVPKGLADFFLVDYVRVDKTGKGFVRFTEELVQNNSEGLPTCPTGYKYNLAFDTGTDGGKSIFAMLLSAKATGKPVHAVGTGSCNIYPATMEDMNNGYFQ